MPFDPVTAISIAQFGLNLIGGIGQGLDRRAQKKITRAEADANIAIIGDYLARFPEYEQLATATYEQQGEQQFRELMSNYGNLNVISGATGQVDPRSSISLVGRQARGDVATFAGEDLSLGGGDGLYGQGYSVLRGNLQAQRKEAEAQLDVWTTTREAVTPGGRRGADWIHRVFGRNR